MPKIVVGQNGLVTNVMSAPAPDPSTIYEWLVPDSQVVNVGDPFDPKDAQIDGVDTAVFQVLYRHETQIRQLIRALRATSTAANNAAATAGLPTAAASADLTSAQARAAFKALIP
jgi:hypothetical protein